MQHFIYPTPLPPPLPPPQSGGRGTILSQEARLHALQIAEEIQAERGSYRKWNEVAKAVNRQYGSNVDGDLVKRQVTSMLRSVQRSGLNSVKRPRKHAEVIQQLLDPVGTNKRPCLPGIPSPLRIRASGEEEEEGMDGEGLERINVEIDESDHGSGTGSDGDVTSPPETGEKPELSASMPSITDAMPTTTTATVTTTGEMSTTTPQKNNSVAAELNGIKSELRKSGAIDGDSQSIERVPRVKKTHAHILQSPTLHQSLMAITPHHFAPPMRVLPSMSVDEVYALITRLHPDVDAEFVRTQDIDGNAFQVLTHKELTEFGVNTFGKRNKLIQLAVNFEPQPLVSPSPGTPQDFYFGRMPAAFSSHSFLDPKTENGESHEGMGKEGANEKKPPVTKVLDLEVVGVRKRYLVERENGLVEVLTPCKLRKYKNLTAAFEHIHPDKLVPIPAFTAPFNHVPSSSDDKPSTLSLSTSTTITAPSPTSSDPSQSLPTTPAQRKSKSKSATSPSPNKSVASVQASTTYLASPAPASYYSMYAPYPPSPYGVMGPAPTHPTNLQWVSSTYSGLPSQRTAEKYHSFHPYTPPK